LPRRAILIVTRAPTTEPYTPSLHDALPILHSERFDLKGQRGAIAAVAVSFDGKRAASAGQRTDQSDDAAIRVWSLETGELPGGRSEEHTSELQSRENLVCRLLLEKKKNNVIVVFIGVIFKNLGNQRRVIIGDIINADREAGAAKKISEFCAGCICNLPVNRIPSCS